MTTKKIMMEEVGKMENKYYRLVWYARKHPKLFDIPGVKKSMKEIEELYPSDVEGLSGENSSWYHGFNSGMLAAMRFILSMDKENLETALENFPELDT